MSYNVYVEASGIRTPIALDVADKKFAIEQASKFFQDNKEDLEAKGGRVLVLEEYEELVIELSTARVDDLCGSCKFPKGAEREPVFMDNNPLSFASYIENKCEGCGHQVDGSTIKDKDIYEKYKR